MSFVSKGNITVVAGLAAGGRAGGPCCYRWLSILRSATPGRSGTYQPSTGSSGCIDCDAGDYQPADGKVACTRCGAAQFSESGSKECSLCADQYYRANPHLPATQCTSCQPVKGVTCHSNATTESLNVSVGHWCGGCARTLNRLQPPQPLRCWATRLLVLAPHRYAGASRRLHWKRGPARRTKAGRLAGAA